MGRIQLQLNKNQDLAILIDSDLNDKNKNDNKLNSNRAKKV